jgi:HEAT repeat protein
MRGGGQMSDLRVRNPEELSKLLDQMTASAITRQANQIASSLNHSSALVRFSAAHALGRVGLKAPALRRRLAKERNPLVITELCDSLAVARDRAAAPLLRRLAATSRSALVRSYSLLAIADILGRDAVFYLKKRRQADRSWRVRATADGMLFVVGAKQSIDAVLQDLASNDSRARGWITNLLTHYAPKRRRRDLLAAVETAAESERVVVIAKEMKELARQLSGGFAD